MNATDALLSTYNNCKPTRNGFDSRADEPTEGGASTCEKEPVTATQSNLVLLAEVESRAKNSCCSCTEGF